MLDGRINIYRTTDVDWFAASNPEDARAATLEMYGALENDENIYETPELLSPDEMTRFEFVEDSYNEETKSFKQKLSEMVQANERFPTMFATTEF